VDPHQRARRRARQWYLHLFDSTQPDLNWHSPDVAAYFDDVVRFLVRSRGRWLPRGRRARMAKSAELVDVEPGADAHPAWDQPAVHDIIRRWRVIGDATAEDVRYWVGEVWVTDEGLGPLSAARRVSSGICLRPLGAAMARAVRCAQPSSDRSCSLARARPQRGLCPITTYTD